ncbi:MAG: homocysteine S-methyltransferase family protein [Clostridia bacterium]|nr:homocysteine S-methyltransferase family protein [Clostridia bacterium]
MNQSETRTIILDGGTGTMLQARGMKAGEDSTVFALNHLDVVEDVARQYIEAGSQAVYTPTFNLTKDKVAGLGETVESLCLKLTAPARKLREEYAAKGKSILMIFDMGPQGELVEPLGRLTFEDAYEFYALQAKAAEVCGADAIAIETMTDIYDVKAAVLAVKESTELPLMVTMTFEQSGRTFLGTGLENMAMVLEGLGVDAIGINCSLGPAQIFPLIQELMTYTELPVIAKPNAGLPDPATGTYDIDADEFVEIMKQYVDAGVAMVGGCCGTTPEYIRGIAEYVASGRQAQEAAEEGVGLYTGEYMRRPKGPLTDAIEAAHRPQDFSLTSLFGLEKPKKPLKVCSGSKVVTVDHVTVIGERLNPTGKKKLKKALTDRDFDYVINQALSQIDAGAEILDVNVGVPGIDEAALMPELVKKLQAITNVPLQIDSSNADAIEAALRVYNGKPIVNSVNGDEDVMDRILPIVKKYGAAVIGLTLDAGGIPQTCEERFAIAERIVKRAEEYGIPQENIIIDCLTLTASAQQKEVDETLKTVRMVKEKLGLATALGVSNVSFGLPLRPVINRTFMTMALENGLDLPIINPNDEDMMASIYAFNVLKNRDEGAAAYIERYKDAVLPTAGPDKKNGAKASNPAAPETTAAVSAEEAAVAHAIENGLEGEAAKAIETLLKTKDAMDIVNQDLIPALDRVGKGFERGEVFLPSMLQSAQAAQAGFDVIKRRMEEEGLRGENAGDVVIATVKGDIHDIGKNIVKVIMENYGFNMIDLGRDVPVEDVVDKVRTEGIRLVGLSALMTTTLASMEETIKAIKAEDPSVKVMVGGAVLTEEYASRMGADYYCSDAMKSVEAAQQVFAEMLLGMEEK